jgi:hypothetical protein
MPGSSKSRSALFAGSPDELIDHLRDVLAWHRSDSQLPAAAVKVLGDPRLDPCAREKATNDGRATVPLAPRPAHVYSEAAFVERPDRQLVWTGRTERYRHLTYVGRWPRRLNLTRRKSTL